MAYSDAYGLQAHATSVQYRTFKDIYWNWMWKNGLSEPDLEDIATEFMGLPITLSVPVLVMPEEEDDEHNSVLRLKIHKTKWHVARTPDNHIYLISPMENHPNTYWIIDGKGTPDLTLWIGQMKSTGAVLESKIFVLPGSDDVEKLLHCYFQLLEINKVRILDLWEVPSDQGKEG